MIYDPSWSRTTHVGSGPGKVAGPASMRWAVLSPVEVGSFDVDFVLVVRDEFPAFQFRDDQPVEVRDDPLGTP